MSHHFVQNVFAVLLLNFITSSSAIIKSVNLTTSNTDIDGASISCVHINDCSINGNEWRLASTDAIGFHLQINLDDSWGFNSAKPSTISLTAYGSTPISPDKDAADDLDPVFVFSVNNAKYITFWTSFDENFQNLIYPAKGPEEDCEAFGTNTPTTKLGAGNVEQIVASEEPYTEEERPYDRRNTRGGKATNGYLWGNMVPFRNPPKNAWPTTYTVINDPVNNQTHVQMMNPTWSSSEILGCSYAESFPTNNGLQIYIAVDHESEHIEFTQFEITYEYETSSPTNDPSSAPTKVPTDSPTPSPTIATDYPSKLPTKSPSNIPIGSPTRTPSVPPTETTTVDPTKSPTQVPTLFHSDPILHAQVPSGFPTKTPLYLNENENTVSTRYDNSEDDSLEMKENTSHRYILIAVIVDVFVCSALLLLYVVRVILKRRRERNVDNANMAQVYTEDERSIKGKDTNLKDNAPESNNCNGEMDGEDRENNNNVMEDIEMEATTKGEHNIEDDEFVIQGDDETIM